MRGGEPIFDLARNSQCFIQRYASSVDPMRQCRSFHQLHDHVIGPNVVQRADVGVIQRRNGASLALESFVEPLFGDFDCNSSAEPRVLSSIDIAHTAGPNQFLDSIRPELCPGFQALIESFADVISDRPLQNIQMRLMVGQQRLDLATQAVVVTASRVQETSALRLRQVGRTLKDLLKLAPAFVTHTASERKRWGHVSSKPKPCFTVDTVRAGAIATSSISFHRNSPARLLSASRRPRSPTDPGRRPPLDREPAPRSLAPYVPG